MLTRRTLLQGAAGAGIAAATPGWARKRDRLVAGGTFPQGVASGIPTEHGTVLWTRLEGVERSAIMWVEVARDAGFDRVVKRFPIRVDRVHDHTAHVALHGLAAGEQFFYRFHTRSTDSPVGRFRTLRPADSAEPVRVAFFSCQNWQTGWFTAHAGLALEDDLDLAVCVGDYIYEAASDPGVREDKIGPDQSAQTLGEYREKYRLYRGDPALQALHAAHPLAICWDDHEVESSYYRDQGGNVQGRERRVPFLRRRANGYRAFFEHMPVRRLNERDRIFRRIALGAHADVVLTDLHQYADPSPCAGAPSQGPVILTPCEEAKDPSRSLLGARQRAWLEDRLTRAGSGWKLWGSSMMLMALDNAPGQPFTVGEWSGWEGERNALAASLRDKGVRDLAAFSGDIHTFFAGQWTTTGRFDGTPVGVEFVSGSMTSSGIAESFGGQDALTDQVRDINPHIAYANTARRGYAVAEASADELRVIFRSPATVKEKVSAVETLASFRVERGTNVVEQA